MCTCARSVNMFAYWANASHHKLLKLPMLVIQAVPVCELSGCAVLPHADWIVGHARSTLLATTVRRFNARGFACAREPLIRSTRHIRPVHTHTVTAFGECWRGHLYWRRRHPFGHVRHAIDV